MKINLLLFLLIPLYSLSQDVEVVSYEISECMGDVDIDRVQPRLIDTRLHLDTLMVKAGMVANCSGILEINALYENDTLHINFLSGDIASVDTVETENEQTITQIIGIAECDCCFEFSFFLTGMKYIPQNITINDKLFEYYPDKYKTYPIEFDIINSDTVNYVDKYGLKQGKWITPMNIKKGLGGHIDFYIDGSLKTTDRRIYNKNGRIKFHLTYYDFDHYRKMYYDSTGTLIKTHVENEDEASTIINEYYSNGSIKNIDFSTKHFSEKTEFYENGTLKSISNKFVKKEFDRNGKEMKTE